jgi:signal peptidase I
MSAEDQTTRSPWITIWFSPRRTIEDLVSTRPTYFVGTLLFLYSAAALYNEMVAADAAGVLSDWRVALGFVLINIAVAVISFYVSTPVINALGRLLGGKGSVMQTRAAYAWSAPPIILCSVIFLLLGMVVKREAIPVLFTLPGLVFSLWSIILFLRMLGRVQDFGFGRALLTGFLTILVAGSVAISFRSFLYQPFSIPSRSMMPTLLVGDYIFVSKFAYGYSRYSLPFSPPVIAGRILASPPSRGDVIVFRVPQQNTDFVKRVVGLPGDRIQMKLGFLLINDTPVGHDPAPASDADRDSCGGAVSGNIKRWRETLPNGVSYETIDCLVNGPFDDTGVYTVPPGQFFVLGDNRDNSTDSRISTFGTVPLENIIGRVSLIYYSRQTDDAGAVSHVRTERIGQIVR